MHNLLIYIYRRIYFHYCIFPRQTSVDSIALQNARQTYYLPTISRQLFIDNIVIFIVCRDK